MTSADFIKLKAFGLPSEPYFAEVVQGLQESFKSVLKIDCYTEEFCHVERGLKEKFPHKFRIHFCDNDFSSDVLHACEEFARQFKNTERNNYGLYKLYHYLHREQVDIKVFLKNYILQNAYAHYIGKLYRHYDVKLQPVSEDRHIFDYLEGNIEVEVVEYLPDEIGFIKMSQLTFQKYLYEDSFWNAEDCFIDIEYDIARCL